MELPEGCDVDESMGVVVCPNGVEFSVYLEPTLPRTKRSEIIQGRSPVKAWGETRQLPDGRVIVRGLVDETDDGWLALFVTDDDELGFELGRQRANHAIVFWGHSAMTSESRDQALAIARSAVVA